MTDEEKSTKEDTELSTMSGFDNTGISKIIIQRKKNQLNEVDILKEKVGGAEATRKYLL